MISFVMLTSWVLLQMSTVVLLDSFTKANLLIEHDEAATSYTKRSTEACLSLPCPTQLGRGVGFHRIMVRYLGPEAAYTQAKLMVMRAHACTNPPRLAVGMS